MAIYLYKEDKIETYYLVNSEAISRYLYSVFKDWGYGCYYNKSCVSNSCYLKVSLGTKEKPKTLHVRVSDHLCKGNPNVKFDYDIYSSFERKNALSYVAFLSKMAKLLNKTFPRVLERVRQGSSYYKTYIIQMQFRRNPANRKLKYKNKDRLYL